MAVTVRPRFHLAAGADADFSPAHGMAVAAIAYAVERGGGVTRDELAAAANTGWRPLVAADLVASAEAADVIAFEAQGNFTLELSAASSPSVAAATFTFPGATATARRGLLVFGSETRAAGMAAHRYVGYRVTNNGGALAVFAISAVGGNT